MEVKVSIIIPTFNRAGFLSKTIASVIAQTISEWECIVVDDGSEDETDELMRVIVESDPRFIYKKRCLSRYKGGNTCRNIGLEYARGEFIQFLDSDDLISPNKLEDQLKALINEDPNAIATCKWGFFSSDSLLSAIPYKPTYKNAQSPLELINIYSRHITYMPLHVFLVKRDVVERAGPWNENLTKSQDTEFFIRVVLKCSKIIFVPSAEVYYRVGAGDNVGTISDAEKAKSAVLCWKLVNTAIFNTYKIKNHSLVRVGITELFKKIRCIYPDVVKDNHDFFELRYSKAEYFCKKVVSRLEMLYYKKVAPLYDRWMKR